MPSQSSHGQPLRPADLSTSAPLVKRHIIPPAEKSWFADNEMYRYGELGKRTGKDVTESPANLRRLRRDVHVLWDSLFFSMVPKEVRNGVSDGTTWRAHSMF